MNYKIAEDIYWVGYIDWDLRNFHGYITPYGSTYNAFLIKDEKPTLIDTVKYYGFDEMLRRIKDVIDPKEIKYIISNHTEMDHSGTIDKLLAYCPNAEVVCSPKGEEGLKKHFKKQWPFKVVKNGDVLDIGKRKLTFTLMPMVHWPDSMATYSEIDKILFPNDAFGQHYASWERYADEVGLDIVSKEAAKYYANIVLPYGAQVNKALDALTSIPVEMICPSHGLFWRRKEDLELIGALYRKWANHETEPRACIVYDTMWKSTETLARTLFSVIDSAGIPVDLINLQVTDISDIVTKVLFSRLVLFGSPILNNHMLPTMARLLMYLKGLRAQKRYALTFGSYGWSTSGYKEFEQSITDAGFELAAPGTYVNFIPGEEDLRGLSSLVQIIQEKLS